MSDTTELQVKAQTNEDAAKALVIVTEEQYLAANAFGSALKALEKEIHASCDPVCDAAYKAHQAATAQRKSLLDPVTRALSIVNAKQIAWKRAEDARIAEERRRAEEEARRKAEEAAIFAAEELERNGMHEAADAALSQPVVVEAVKVPDAPKAEGTSYRATYKASVKDLMALVKAIAAGSQPLYFVEPATSALNQAAKASKGTAQIPGVLIEEETIIARRSA